MIGTSSFDYLKRFLYPKPIVDLYLQKLVDNGDPNDALDAFPYIYHTFNESAINFLLQSQVKIQVGFCANLISSYWV